LDVQVIGVKNVPFSGISSVVLNMTAVAPSASGYLTVYPAGTIRPVASNLNFRAKETVANLVEVPVSPSGQVAIYNGSDGNTNVVVDVEGYVTSSSGHLYNPISPLRICDTRSGNPSNLGGKEAQCSGKTLTPNTPLQIQVGGLGSIPLTASAVVINLTAVMPVSGGYLTAYPAGSTIPLASNVNFSANRSVPNSAIVALSSSGTIDIVSDTTTNAIVDVEGYFSSSGSSYTPISPVRIADTRCSTKPMPTFCASENLPSINSTLGTLTSKSNEMLSVAGVGSIPSGIKAVVLNVTVAGTTAGSYLTAYPAGTILPTASNLNWLAGETVPNLVTVEVGSNGGVNLYNDSGSTNVIVDVEGYYG
jgi:hypothetical protein